MRGDTENSTTKKKVISFYSTDGMAFSITCKQAPGAVVFYIQAEESSLEIELSRTEAIEVAEFIRRGV